MAKNDFIGLFAGIIIVAFLLAILIFLNASDSHRFAQLGCKCDVKEIDYIPPGEM